MNIRLFIKVILMIMILSACSSIDNTDLDDDIIYNETYNKVAEYQGNVYYIKDKNLWQNINAPQLFIENVHCVQEYNNNLFYVVRSDEDIWLMKFDGKIHSKASTLPTAESIHMMISNDTIYVLADHKLLYKKIAEEEFSLIESQTIDFTIYNEKIYYVTVNETRVNSSHGTGETFDTYILDVPQTDISSQLVSIDLDSGKKTIIAENDSGFLMVPTNVGLVYYDRDKTILYHYKNSRSSKIKKALITSMISYGNNVIYTAFNRNAAYEISIDDGAEQKILDGIYQIIGISYGYIYTITGEWIKSELLH